MESQNSDVQNLTHIGLLMDLYRNHIKAAYDLSEKMREQGFERPWITVQAITTGILGNIIQIDKKLRLEIR